MLSLILASTLLLSGAPPPSGAAPPSAEIYRVIPLENILGGMIGDFFPLGAPDGVRDALILMDHGGTILVTDFSLFEIDTANAELKISLAAGEEKPAVIRTVYMDRNGFTHEIVTDCKRYSTFERCAAAHGELLAVMDKLFPIKDTLIGFNEINPRHRSGSGGVVILPGLIIEMLRLR